jgi:hypothetical protein
MPSVEIEAELKRRSALDDLVNWLLVNDPANADTGLSDPVIDHGARALLLDVLTALQGTLQVAGDFEVNTDNINVDVDKVRLRDADDETLMAAVNAAGQLLVDAGYPAPFGVISDENSTDTPLGSGATYTGTGIEVLDFVSCEVTVFANVASADQGLRLETSPDGTNWSHYHTYTVPANANRCYQFTLSARYFRVVYVNGGTAQTTFRLQTRLSRAAAAPHYHELDHPVDGTHPAQIVRAVLTGEQTGGPGSGDYINVRVNPQGRLAAEVQAQTLGDPIGPTAFTSGLEDPDGDLAVPLLDAARRQLVTDQHAQALTDAQLRDSPVPVNTGLAQPLEEGGTVAVSNQPADPATDTTLTEVRNRLAPTLPADAGSGLPERLHVQQIAPLPTGPHAIGFTTDSGVLEGALGTGFAAGGPPQSTTNVVRALLVNPAASGKVLIVAGFVVGHDEGNNLIPVQVIRNPTTNLPSTSHDEMNLSMGAPHGPFSSVASFFQDTGSAMGGAGDSMWVPSTGAAPNSYELRIPAFIWPDNSIGVNFDIGALLSSGTGQVAVVWSERDEADILTLLAANGVDLGGP